MADGARTASLTFHGGVGTVTGSKYLLEAERARLLIDCGMFQGIKSLRQRNWQAWPFDPRAIDAVLLSHAHLDHSGMLPALHLAGFTGPVYCTPATAALLGILLPDSGRIGEEDARHANRHGWSRHDPARPLYNEAQARAALALLQPVDFGIDFEPAPQMRVRFRRAGHILGAAWIQLTAGDRRMTFSGDVGRSVDLVMNPPDALEPTDYLVIESTYGDRHHAPISAETELRDVISRTAARGGTLLIPAFAVGRVQEVLYLLWRLRESGAIRDVPVYLDSPLAIDATELFRGNAHEHRLTVAEAQSMCSAVHYTNGADESRALNRLGGPLIIVSSSGMLTGGRVLHHIRARAGDARNTILLTGYQAHGTRGAALLGGADRLKIHGEYYPVRAEVCAITSLSAHADSAELIDWLTPLATSPPTEIFVTHGEPPASRALAQQIRAKLACNVHIPELGERRTLTR